MRVVKVQSVTDAQEFLRKECNKAMVQLLDLEYRKEMRILLDFSFEKVENTK